ncbi:MAG: hypothetical protein LBB89_07350 [Treponema sp.]|jgi:hypothetical protein|nr:hypothetical protein [Treponema sp.]
MNEMKKTALVFILSTLCAGAVFSIDFRLLLDNNIEAENSYFSYTSAFIPWFSWSDGQGMSAYLSGILSLKYNKYEDDISDNDGWREPVLLPELGRFSFTYRSSQRYSIEAGRVEYADALGQTACGLFDGIRFQAATPACRVTAGAFYTGLLYKETAKILMTANDAVEYVQAVEDFSGYCASKRLLAFGRVDIPLMEYHNLSFETFAQFDLNGNEEKLHSQYAQAAVEIFTPQNIRISGGFVFETMENEDGDFTASFAALASVDTDLPGSLNDNLNLTAKYSGGPMNETFAAFVPLTTVTQGMVFSGTFSGLWMAKINYAVRLLPSLFAEANAGYFGRTYSETGSDGSLYGGEFWASLSWQPLEDIRATLGGGVFVPAMGNSNSYGTDTLWKINVGLLLAF